MLKMIKTVIDCRAKLAHKVGGKLEGGERVTHFLYGTAIVMEHHWELSFYSLSALSLGCFALLTVFIGHQLGE